MGLSASQARFLSLTSRKSAIEFRGQGLNQQRMVLSSMQQQYANEMTAIMNTTDFNGFTLNPLTGNLIATGGGDPATAAQYNSLIAEVASLHALDKDLEVQLKDVDTQHTEVQTEIDAVKKVIDKNIDMTFKTFA